jgi:hypothetical protein
MAYSGKYIVKKPNKYRGDPSKVTYRSHWEKLCFMWCENNPDIKDWSSEETVVPYYYDVDKKYHRYFVDLKITFKNGKTILVEIKPEKETAPPKRPDKSKRYIGEALTYVKNMNKWEAANEFAKDRGWDFQIWTENTLKSMGIMKEQKGKLKQLKPLKPYRKKSKK